MTAISRTDLNTQINTNLADNTQGDISALDVRQVSLNQSDSAFNKISDNASDIQDGGGKVIMTDEERTKLDNLPETIDADYIGLGNVDNTSDADKPVSTATQAALNSKVSSDNTGITGADIITNMVSLTQAEYDAISSPNASTIYVIVG